MMKAVVFTACDTPDDVSEEREGVKSHWLEQLTRYKNCHHVGLVFVFITDGYKGVLGHQDPWRNLNKEHLMRSVLEEIIKEIDADEKIRIVGVRELIPTMAGLERAAEKDKTELARLLLAGELILSRLTASS